MASHKNQSDSADPGGFHENAIGKQKPEATDVDTAINPGGFHEITASAEPESGVADGDASGLSTDPQS